MKTIFRTVNATLGMAILATVFSSLANAQCVDTVRSKQGAAIWRQQSWTGKFSPALFSLVSAAQEESASPGVDPEPIVGFWRVKFLSEGNEGNYGIPDGTVLDAAYSQWHSDGTEIMNSSRPPATQSFCLGVWKKTGRSTYKLNHFGISWDPNGSLIGPANIRQEVTLGRDHDSFGGTFTIDQYDQAGNSLVHLVGQIEAKRITMDTSVSDVL